GEIENTSQKRQRNFLKQENERVKLGDKHDGILYMDVQGTPVEVGFLEVVGREFHLLSMHFIDDMYIVDEFDAFVIPDSGLPTDSQLKLQRNQKPFSSNKTNESDEEF
ncbi:3028_t:CDS:2, partial [Gigaspora margarita]